MRFIKCVVNPAILLRRLWRAEENLGKDVQNQKHLLPLFFTVPGDGSDGSKHGCDAPQTRQAPRGERSAATGRVTEGCLAVVLTAWTG